MLTSGSRNALPRTQRQDPDLSAAICDQLRRGNRQSTESRFDRTIPDSCTTQIRTATQPQIANLYGTIRKAPRVPYYRTLVPIPSAAEISQQTRLISAGQTIAPISKIEMPRNRCRKFRTSQTDLDCLAVSRRGRVELPLTVLRGRAPGLESPASSRDRGIPGCWEGFDIPVSTEQSPSRSR
jgi:hypothetical protein